MATKTVTTYICDGCNKPAAKGSDLRRFSLKESRIDGKDVAEAKTDLCGACEKALHTDVLGFFPPKEREKLEGIVRG